MADKETIERLRRLIEDLQKNQRDAADTLRYPDKVINAASGNGLCLSYSSERSVAPVREEEEILSGFSVKKSWYFVDPKAMFEEVPDTLLQGFRALDPSLSQTTGWLYLDIETTGLLGAGTVAFLVGTGQWTEEGFLVTQYFLREREAEDRMLHRIEQVASAASSLITFNGKAFDWPLLVSRYIVSGLKPPALRSHVDLLALARTIGRLHEQGSTLQDCINRFLGRSRSGDIPGHLIPALYFIYEREGDEGVLSPVFAHNRLDVIDMVSLARVFAHFLSGDDRPVPDYLGLHGAGRFHYRRRNFDLAKRCLEASLGTSDHIKDSKEAAGLRLLSTILRSNGQWDRAARIWERLIDRGLANVDDYLWLSRYHEKVRQDLDKSAGLVKQALTHFCTSSGEGPPRLMSRKRRLERKGLL